ncbi:uncharacterized protein LOC118436832 [Folsomia candida]|uniref:F-box domain-containing protein n=1 Tax=Folsomia candida TaxID=158441 RepID=A0A226DVI9_FOLCA|nr:uncharacterized protein LOC118436832 [Folsomia candida]XP_035711362.1 uncharacterized protein LOC118436832 [Folsomia candida]XP_035711363.1 uncharacterized protein LOC118436832 [Folsomia candida]XP_035711364.1 uncharacterized protein LOC118436832 [Folsomia candida]OXA49273.1 hypothetical protein Fcan01_15944 [Folsomia candida]
MAKTPSDGVLKPKYNTDCEMRSVILPYREGVKYTFGDEFISREEQGEFVFLNVKPIKWNWSPTSLVEISCEAGKYLVKSGEVNIVIKNGVILDVLAYSGTWLNFGDELQFTKYHDDISGGLAMFTFQKRECATNWDTTVGQNSIGSGVEENSSGLNFNPGLNQVIFSHIVSHLSLGNLLSVRLVCKQWDKHVAPLVRKKCVINFRNSSTTPSLKFSRYVHEMKGVAPFPNWTINCPYSVPGKRDDDKGRAAKYFADLNWFLHPRWGHHVKTLSLSGHIYSDPDYGVYIKIVTFFKDTLEQLRVHFYMKIFNEDGHEENYSMKKSDDLVFKNLQKFSMTILPYDSGTLTVSAPWIKTWACAIKGVDSMEVLGSAWLGSRFVQELQKVGTLSYKNLREIVLTCRSEDAINFLTKVKQPLKKVTFGEPLEIRDVPKFENFLKKCAGSLQLLSFRISTKGMEEKSRFALNFPCLRNLKKLDIHFGLFKPYHFGEEKCFIKDVARFRLSFPPLSFGNDRIDHGRHLPLIRSIVVTPSLSGADERAEFWNTYSDLIDSLLPKVAHSCETLRNFEIPSNLEFNVKTSLLRGDELPDIFPNVRSKWINDLQTISNN